MNKLNMTQGISWIHLLRFSLPVFLGYLLQQLYNTVDAMVVGKFAGESSLSAVGTTASFVFFFLAIATGFSAGNGVVVAQYYGADQKDKVRESAATGITFLMMLGVVFTIFAIVISRPAYIYFVNVPNDYIELTLIYFRVYAIGLVFQFGYNIFSAILRAIGDSAATLYFLLISSVINVVLDILFVAYFHMGVYGAAVATVISQAALFVAAYLYMIKKYPIFRFRLREYKLNKNLVNKTVQIGFPMSLQLIVVSLGLTLIQRVVNAFGQVMTASFTVGYRIEMYLHLPCNTFQTSLATYTGQNIGAGKMDRVKKGAKQAVLMSVIFTIVISIIILINSDFIITLFGLGEHATIYCLSHIRAIAVVTIILSMYLPLFGVFQGANHSILPMFVAICALGIRVVVTYLFCYSDIFGHSIIWWNGIFGFGTGFLVTWTFYLSGIWQKNAKL